MTLRNQSRLPPTHVDAYLLWTHRGNAGDWLIADGCEHYLRDRGLDVWRSDGSLENAAVDGDTNYLAEALADFRGMVMFAGGGNIGIYPDNEETRAKVIACLSWKHRCLVFSQSALRPEPSLIDSRVTVWCRDTTSLAILSDAGTRTALVPDMAWYMDDRFAKAPGGDGIFFVRRTVSGDAETLDHRIELDCDTEDLTLSSSLERIVERLAPYDIVVSDRLHGGLIALMMRKKVVFLPVGYHKIRAFYETWLPDVPCARFAATAEEVNTAMASLHSATLDLSALVRRHADPAFDRFLLES
jgi:exopolysaccharide biosynthesis predicted pyruvyltransferase EpsI